MKFKNISKKLESEDVYNVLIKNFSKLNADWVYHQWNWLHQNYSAFNDLIKYFITIALVRDTLKFYKDIGHTYNFNEYYSYPEFQIEKFSISNLAKEFRLPKETMRRKIIELEKLNIIRKKGKKIYFDRSAFDVVKPKNWRPPDIDQVIYEEREKQRDDENTDNRCGRFYWI